MFTGLIQGIGVIKDKQDFGEDCRLAIATTAFDTDKLEIGASICTSGTCITVIEKDNKSFTADISAETCRTTTFAGLDIGSYVNLEQSLTLETKLGGHLVTGHVDDIGKILKIEQDAKAINYNIELPQSIARYLVKKGSVVVDGTSLTVNAVTNNVFNVSIIPHTQECTVIKYYKVGTLVNLEIDLIARYVERLLEYKQ